jgi:hypothetical protein
MEVRVQDGQMKFNANRAHRRRLKKAMRLPFTPSRDFARALDLKANQAGAEKPVRIDREKVQLERAWEQDGAQED